MAHKRKRTQRVKTIFKLTHWDGKGIKYIAAYTLVGACLLAGWDSDRVEFEMITPTDKNYQASKRQPGLPGI